MRFFVYCFVFKKVWGIGAAPHKMIRFAESLGLNRKFTMSKENKDNASGVDLNLLFDMGDQEENK